MPPTSAPEKFTADQFARYLIESELLPADEVRTLLGRMPPTSRNDFRPFAQQLIRGGKLTPYQATMIAQGKIRGLILDQFVLLEKLGQGGMGMVFKARDRRNQQTSAIKVLPPSFTLKPNAVQRFQREIQAASRLKHPNIVGASGAGEAAGAHYMVMEFVDGIDLSRLVKQQGPLPAAQAVACILQAAAGLAHAHAAGLIHRDIKPGNLLLDKSGTIKILDMGLVRFGEGEEAADELTKTGTILGTCDYVAPEQAVNSKNADARSDLYSLGCTLFYLLTGKAMYGGETMMEKLLAHRAEPVPSLRKFRPEVPKALDTVFQKSVAKKPDDRYQSVTDLAAALEVSLPANERGVSLVALASAAPRPQAATEIAATTDHQTMVPSVVAPDRRRRNLLLALAGGVALAGLVGIIGVILLVRALWPDSRPVARATEPAANRPTTTAAVKPPDTGRPPEARPGPGPVDEAWIKSLANMGPGKMLNAFVAKMRERNPGYGGGGRPHWDGRSLIGVEFDTDSIGDLWAVRGLPNLRELRCAGPDNASRGKLSDLAPLHGLPLRVLQVGRNPINDIAPLQGMPLTRLALNMTQVADLTPLQGMKLESLDLTGTPVTDLTPLKGMPLQSLAIRRTSVTDLSPLVGMPLQELAFDPKTEAQLEILRGIPTLKRINDNPAETVLRRLPK